MARSDSQGALDTVTRGFILTTSLSSTDTDGSISRPWLSGQLDENHREARAMEGAGMGAFAQEAGWEVLAGADA